jgi:hypothetical protein
LHLSQTRATDIDLPIYKEFFYWGESTALMIIKQAHSIKRYIKDNNLSATFMTTVRDRRYHDFISRIIYLPRLFSISFNSEKVVGNDPLMPWDKFFMKDTQADYYLNWKTQVEQLDKLIPDKFKHLDSPVLNLKGILSKRYSIGK